MLDARLPPLGGHRPCSRLTVNLTPGRLADFTPARGRQDEELERDASHARSASAQIGDKSWHVGEGHRFEMALLLGLARQRHRQRAHRQLGRPVAFGAAPIEDGADGLADTARRLGFRQPDAR